MDKRVVHQDMERTRRRFHRLLDTAGYAELRRRSAGTRWTNRQLLFHMLLGYLIMRALLTLARLFDRLPAGASRRFARLLDAATTPFDAVNFAGSWLGGTILPRRSMDALLDRTVAAQHRRLDRETDAGLARGMHYPTRWDPFFADYMTVADLYRFPARHFEFHQAQLTLPDAQT
ncbi:DinB family protein [Amycolatopsis sp., V23-08]|uniref:DinB family protein n=1 Tax=Amycolatopsis heterodermiae TaxID=3110235 RepID=A0ABU5RNW1_9PSEU|nr:DinB family protein [Amycolatopsis sp., V23-08]MEA5367150.1 DinB family protein [Amycolatopsis sp., V23-08]